MAMHSIYGNESIRWGRRASAALMGAGASVLILVFVLALPSVGFAGVFYDLHYNGLDSIDISELPESGEITLSLDIGFDGLTRDGVEYGSLGGGVAVRFDLETATFLGGANNASTFFDPIPGVGGIPFTNEPDVLFLGNPNFPDNEVKVGYGISINPSFGQETALNAQEMTFRVTAPTTFDVLFGEGDALLFATLGGFSERLLLYCDATGGDTDLSGNECEEQDVVRFDGFAVTENGVVVEAAGPQFIGAGNGGSDPPPMGGGGGGGTPAVPEPSGALLFGAGLGLAAWRLGRRSTARPNEALAPS